MAQPDLPAPLAVAYTDAELVVSEQLRRRKDDLGRRMVNQYVLEKRIGKGQHGIVYRAEVSQGDGRTVRAVAIKMVMRNDKHEDRMRMLRHNNRPIPRDGNHLPLTARLGSHENKIRKEIAIMKKCKNAHIVRLLEVIDDKTNKKIYMVMEYMGGGEIKWRDTSEHPILTVDQTRRIIRDVVLGIEYLHYNGIIHRDIKPANLLWSTDRQRVKIADFGVSHFSYAQSLGDVAKLKKKKSKSDSKHKPYSSGNTSDAASESPTDRRKLLDPGDIVLLDDSDLSKRAGTPGFFAPELILDMPGTDEIDPAILPPRRPVTKAIDIWALGVTLYCLLFGRVPWVCKDENVNVEYATYRLILRQEWTARSSMGLDKVETGGRHPQPVPIRTRSGKEVAQPEGAVVMRLLDWLLQKDAAKRAALSDVKRYPWFLRDIPDAEAWLSATAPAKHAKLFVTEEDTKASMSPLRFIYNQARRVRSLAKMRNKPAPEGKSTAGDSTEVLVQRQRSIKNLLPGMGGGSSSRRKTPPSLQRSAGKKSDRSLPYHDDGATSSTPGTPRGGSRRGSDAQYAPTPSPAGTMGSGTTSPGSPYTHSPKHGRGSMGSLFEMFNRLGLGASKALPSSSGGGGPTAASTTTSCAPSVVHSPTEPISPRTIAGPVRTALPRTGSASVLQGAPRQWPVSASAGAALAPDHIPRRGLSSYGVGGGQLAAEMRASSFGEPADYPDVHEHAPDVMSVHSGGDLDDDALLFGAGGVADRPMLHNHSHGHGHGHEVHTPTTPHSPGHAPFADLAATMPAAVPPSHVSTLIEGELANVHAETDPAMQDTGGYLSRVASGGRPSASSPLAHDGYMSGEEDTGLMIGGDFEGLEADDDEGDEWSDSDEDEVPGPDGLGGFGAARHYSGGGYSTSSSSIVNIVGARDDRASTAPSDQFDTFVGSPGGHIYDDEVVLDDDESADAPAPVEIRRRRGSTALSAAGSGR